MKAKRAICEGNANSADDSKSQVEHSTIKP
jgi:hypothetical protein